MDDWQSVFLRWINSARAISYSIKASRFENDRVAKWKESFTPRNDSDTNSNSDIQKKHKIAGSISEKNKFSLNSSSFNAAKYLETRTDFLSSVESEISGKEKDIYIEEKNEHSTTEKIQSLTLIQMMNAGMHLGHSKTTLSHYFRQYVLGIRHGIAIIDLDKTLASLRRACQVAYEISKLGGIILLVGTRPTYSGLVERVAREIGIFFISTEWKNGLLTNAKRTLKVATSSDAVLFTPLRPIDELGPLAQQALLKSSVQDTVENRYTNNEPTSTPSQVTLPDLVIVIDGPTNSKAFEECHSVLIPTIGIIDSNFDPTLCTYPIPANDDSIASVDFVLSILANSIKDGRSRTFPQS